MPYHDGHNAVTWSIISAFGSCMNKENITRFTCERCGMKTEIETSLFHRMPRGWSKTQNALLCLTCKNAFETLFRKFLNEKD